MKYVSDQALKMAKDMEKKLQNLPSEAGLIFIGVSPSPEFGGEVKTFHVHLGIARSYEYSTASALIHHIFKTETDNGFEIIPVVIRGVSGACRDDHNEAAHKAEAEKKD